MTLPPPHHAVTFLNENPYRDVTICEIDPPKKEKKKKKVNEKKIE